MTTFREQYGPPAAVSGEQLTLAIEADANPETERRYTGRKAWEQDVAWGHRGFASGRHAALHWADDTDRGGRTNGRR